MTAPTAERVLVCGGRDYADRQRVFEVLDEYRDRAEVLIDGGAEGADMLAEQWAMSRDVPMLTFRADWQRHGRAAGPIRNGQMLAQGKPTLVIAFPGGRGTADMVRQARTAGVPVREIGVAHDPE
ncbi:DUF2493 domain-containing protein [Rhodovarius crocodyli]|uniref:DUF2493 domain-containing protein n=1 Tax=Rhodovarius crocodyli TaxID=1979269 RepID=A0A437LV71_9PROT|nr:DUF2493 domain-containing protein [Rhodovarius crocodyli]RVT89267.1 DUF2493 domain-containing protein [Rhodovarius crocodyli]